MKRILSTIVTTDEKSHDLIIAPVKARSPFHRSPAIQSLAIAGSLVSALLLSSQAPVSAATVFTGSGTNPESGTNLAAKVEFSLESLTNGKQKLIVTLTNTADASIVNPDGSTPNNTKVPSDLLTAVFFDGLTSTDVSSPTLTAFGQPAPAAYPGNSTTGVNPIPLDLGPGGKDEWRLPNTFSGLPSGFTYGFGTAGFGIFSGGGGGQQFEYGLATLPCDNVSVCYAGINPNAPLRDSGNTFIRNSVRLELTDIASGFTLDKITQVRFQYGTNLSEPNFPGGHGGQKVPEPSLLLGIGAAVGSSLLLRRRKSS